MSKQCGYLDQKGGFHRSLLACNNANMDYELRNVINTIQSLTNSYAMRYASELQESLSKEEARNASTIIDKIFTQLLVGRRDMLIEYGAKIKELESKRDSLQSKQQLPRILRADWWLGNTIEF